MFWVDDIVDEILRQYPDTKEFVIRDEKTLSGRVHVGSLRGVVIHGLIAQALNERGRAARFLFEFNDADPMDGLPVYLNADEYRQHMGKPLKDVPSPDGQAKDYPTYFGEEFLHVIHALGFRPEIVRASEQYSAGHYDEWIDKALGGRDKIRAIYREVSGSQKPDDWYPLQVVCEKCGKVGTTVVTGYDGKEVTYRCEPAMVKWAVGCGYSGKVSPFRGRGKLPWKVEWPVKWLGYGVTIEGAGMDHAAAGGSREVGMRICREVLGGEPPFDIPYGFFLLEGAKMSSSKGKGATAKEMSDVLPPSLLRFLLTKTRPITPINFSPDGESIPRLFDEYDRTGKIFFGEDVQEDVEPEALKRLFHFSQIDQDPPPHFVPRFAHVVFFSQIPHLDVHDEIAKVKGSALTEEDREEVAMRLLYAEKWITQYAPASHVFQVVEDHVPVGSGALSDEQKKFLAQLADMLEDFVKNNKLAGAARGEALHGLIHTLCKQLPLSPRAGFSAIYASLIGKDSGPQAGWFLEALDSAFVMKRFRDVAALPAEKPFSPEEVVTSLLSISPDAVSLLHGITVGVARLSDLSITASNPDLEAEKVRVLASINPSDIKKTSPILSGYKDLFKSLGIDSTKRKPSPCALFDRLAYGKDLYRINSAVDACNLMVLTNHLSFGLYDAARIRSPLHLRLAEHEELFHAMGDEKPKQISKGELVYADDSGSIICRDYNYRDSALSIVDTQTKDVLLVIDGNHSANETAVQKMLDDTVSALQKYNGGTVSEKYVISL